MLLAEKTVSQPSVRSRRKRWVAIGVPVVLLLLGSAYVLATATTWQQVEPYLQDVFTKQMLFFMVVGFVAQMIDGALGMAYGISSTSFLLGLGVPPALASSSVHVAEVFISGISGLSHLRMGNVNKQLFRRLVIPGVIGAFLGAYLLTKINGEAIKPYIAVYLLIMGIVVIRKAFLKNREGRSEKSLAPLALFGGFIDAVGGGGWGPIVASTLLSKGHSARYTIGSVNLAEFFIALSGAITFVTLIGTGNWQIIVGLVLGGSIAAPFAAYLCRKFPTRTLMIMVGVLIIGLSIRTLILTFF